MSIPYYDSLVNPFIIYNKALSRVVRIDYFVVVIYYFRITVCEARFVRA